ncbi:mas-related G-protein coupled receptor member D [Camelus ferus]|nr:mas-related G-protein coupled receptor member D [Camelus ferus]
MAAAPGAAAWTLLSGGGAHPHGAEVLVLFACVGSIAGNSLVVWLLGVCGQRGTMGTYILHLAAADLLFLFCSAVLTILNATAWAARVHHLGLLAVSCAKYLAYMEGLSLLTAASAQPCLWLLPCLEPGPLAPAPSGSTVDTIFHILTLVSFTPLMALSSTSLFIQVQKSPRPRQRRPTRLYVVTLVCVFVLLVCTLPLGISGFLLYWLDPP